MLRETTFPIRTFPVEVVRPCSDMLKSIAGDGTLEGTAQALVDFLRAALVDDDGAPACPLVRLYKTHPYALLGEELQEFARRFLDVEARDDLRCLTLLGTAGELPEWNDRRSSRGHRTIPLPSEQVVARLPMISQLIGQLGIDVGDVVSPPRGAAAISLAQQTTDVFHVAEAQGSPYLPAQDEFVAPYGIRSAVGFGGILLSGDFFACVLFSRVPISATVARTLKILGLPIRLRLLPFARARLA